MAITVFMYHRILPYRHPEAVDCDLFSRQLEYLKKHFRMLSPDELSAALSGNALFPSQPAAALTFDDGYADNWLYATPILKKHSLSAICAVSASYLYEGTCRESISREVLDRSMAEARQAAAKKDFSSYASDAELRQMVESGVWRLAAHGTRHELGDHQCSILAAPQSGASLADFKDFLRQDLENCRQKLAMLPGVIDGMFFWPYGHWSRPAAEIAAELGFRWQFSVHKGLIVSPECHGVYPRVGVSARWKKFHKNVFIFRHRVLTLLHDCFHTEKLNFDDCCREN